MVEEVFNLLFLRVNSNFGLLEVERIDGSLFFFFFLPPFGTG